MVGEMFSINEASGIPFRAAYGILEELRKLLMMNKTEDVIRTSREKASKLQNFRSWEGESEIYSWMVRGIVKTPQEEKFL
jgi:hypothetical protein